MGRRSCNNGRGNAKRVYRAEVHARAVAMERAERLREPLVAYYCPYHLGWHIGHPTGYRKAQRMRETVDVGA